MRRLPWILIAVAASCSATPPPPPGTTFHNQNGNVSVDVVTSPFGIVVRDAQGNVLLETAPQHALSTTHNANESTTPVVTGWDYYKGEDDPWVDETRVDRKSVV